MIMARPASLPAKIPALLGVLALVVFAALSLSTNAATRFYQWPWFFYWQVLLIAPIAAVAGRLLWRARLTRFGGWLDGGFVLFTTANVIAALLGPFRPQSLNLALIPVAGASLAYLGLDWIERGAGERARRIALFAEVIGILMVLFIAVSLGLWLFTHVLPAWSGGSPLSAALRIRNAEPFGHSLYTAGAAVLSAPWLAALGLTGPRRRRAPLLAGAVLALALVITTASRGGVLAVAVMLACAAAIWIVRAPLSIRHRLLIAAGALAAAAIAVALEPRLRSLVLHREWSSAAAESNRQHASMLRAGWLMGCHRPFSGYGPGAVPRIYPGYRAQLSGGADNVLQLHNTPVQIWAELGLPGIAALVLLLTGIFNLARGPGRRPGAGGMGILPLSETAGGTPAPPVPALPIFTPDQLRAQAALVALTGYSVMSLFDYQLDVPWFAATVAALLVILRASSVDPAAAGTGSAISTATARMAGGLLLAGLAAMAWSTAWDLRARQLFAEAAGFREAGDAAAFVAGAERAAAVAPQEPFYPTQLAAFFARQYVQAGNEADRTRARDRCCELLRRTLRVDPDQDYCHFNLGWLLLKEQPVEAERHFRASARLSPYRGGVYLGIGLSLLGRDEDAAATAFALEWANDPHAVTSPRWDLPPLSAWRDRAEAALQGLASRWLKEEPLSAPEQARIRYAAALARWWIGRSADVAALIRDGSLEQRRFFRNLDAMERRAYAPADPGVLEPWEQLYVAWRDAAVPSALDAGQPAFAAALRRKIGEHPQSFIRVLTGPAGGEAGLVRLGQNDRPGYSVQMRNQDGFPLRDLYIYPENLVVEKYASFLFPEKGRLPDRLLLKTAGRTAPVAISTEAAN
jgi:O-antigen ligase